MIKVVSFGYKYGIPEADIVLDVRWLPNPHNVKQLKHLTGLHKEVSDYVMASAKDFVTSIIIQSVDHDVVAIGCYGGKHRSVAIAQEIARITGVPCIHLNLQ